MSTPTPAFSLADTLKRALAAYQAGDTAEARRLCGLALDAQPKSFDALHLAGLVAARRGQLDKARRLIGKAIAINPRHPPAHVNLGNVLKELHRPDGALESYGRALALRADHAEAHNNIGIVLQGQGKLAEAEAAYRNAIRAKPDYAAAHHHLGNALKDQGRLDDAVAAYRRAIELRPDYRETHNNLGNALKEQAKTDEAIAAYRNALRQKPDDPETLGNLGATFYEQGKFAEAMDCYGRATALKPGDARLQDSLGTACHADGRTGDAVAAFNRAFAIKLASAEVSPEAKSICPLLTELIDVPVLYDSEEQVAQSRGAYARNLARLADLCAAYRGPGNAREQELIAECLLRISNFPLGYHQQDEREFQEQYVRIATHLLKPRIGEFLKPIAPKAGRTKIRVGVASELLRQHNGAKWTYGWLSNLPAADYEFFFYSLNGVADALTRRMAALGVYRWLPFRETSYVETLGKIRADDLDALIIPDIGMTVSSRIVSLARLAPIQMMGWGHPITSGSPMVDYFMSGALMEPSDGEAHYTETLVRMPNLGIALDRSEADGATGTRAQFGLPDGKTVFGSAQALMKYLPRYDEVFPRIAEQAPDALFVFVGARRAHMTEAFEARLRRAFARRGMAYDDRVRILPYLTHAQFVQLFDAIDVNLDSIGWTGGHTTAISLARDCPVVTTPGEFMRGRHTHGMLRMIGVEELSAPSVDGYVALAARLGRDRDYRAALAAKIKANKRKLFDDMECVRFLDAFFKEKIAALRRA